MALSPREIETLGWLIRGCSYKQIAKQMNITDKGVATHMYGIRHVIGEGNCSRIILKFLTPELLIQIQKELGFTNSQDTPQPYTQYQVQLENAQSTS